jgi:hypothetical protein
MPRSRCHESQTPSPCRGKGSKKHVLKKLPPTGWTSCGTRRYAENPQMHCRRACPVSIMSPEFLVTELHCAFRLPSFWPATHRYRGGAASGRVTADQNRSGLSLFGRSPLPAACRGHHREVFRTAIRSGQRAPLDDTGVGQTRSPNAYGCGRRFRDVAVKKLSAWFEAYDGLGDEVETRTRHSWTEWFMRPFVGQEPVNIHAVAKVKTN